LRKIKKWYEVPTAPGYSVTRSGKVRGKNGRVLKSWTQIRGGYPAVKIRVAGESKTVCVHRLVLETFVGPKPDGQEACHINGDPTDNRVENLYWGSRSQNMQDMSRHGTHAKIRMPGESHPQAKLTEEDVRQIRARHIRGDGRRQSSEGDASGCTPAIYETFPLRYPVRVATGVPGWCTTGKRKVVAPNAWAPRHREAPCPSSRPTLRSLA